MDGFFTIERNMIHFENSFLVNLLFSEKYEFGPQMTKIYIKIFFEKNHMRLYLESFSTY